MGWTALSEVLEIIKIANNKEQMQKLIFSNPMFEKMRCAKNSELDATDAALQSQILNQGRLTDQELAALKSSLQGQIDANSDLSADERQKLLDIINGLDNSTASSITSIKKYLLEQLGDTNENITNIVNGMEIDLTDIRNRTFEKESTIRL